MERSAGSRTQDGYAAWPLSTSSAIHDQTLAVLLTRRDGRERAALVSPEDGDTIGYGALERRVLELAGRLASVGVGKGDRVALVLPNGPEFVQILFAITVLGAAAAPLNPAYTADEHGFYLDDLQPRLLVVPAGEMQAAREAAGGEVVVVEVLIGEHGAPGLSVDGRRVEEERPFDAGGADDIALLLHTSGTTSRPKQVPLLQRNLLASAQTIASHYALTPEDVSFVAMPLFHVHGLVASVLGALAGGGSAVVPRRLSPQRFWGQARTQAVTWFSAGPTLHQMILDKQGGEPAPPRLRFTRSCSSAMSPALMQRLEDVYGVPLLEAYGMTEASHQMASNPLPPGRREPGSVGIATGTEIRVVDKEGAEAPAGSAGEVVIRGAGVTPGYQNNPEANADAFRGGWFRTGDRGVIEDGYLYLQGRIKEMILRGGENISPYEIEDVLLAHPFVSDAVCYALPDELYGEEVAAAVVVSGQADERELRTYCRERLAAFKVPKTIRIVDEIPRTATGKLQRRRVAAMLDETER
jgi:acyl-CoA synthetase (AMP-forming)/AMP-acid ligase II